MINVKVRRHQNKYQDICKPPACLPSLLFCLKCRRGISLSLLLAITFLFSCNGAVWAARGVAMKANNVPKAGWMKIC